MRGVFTTIPTGPDTQILVNLGITYKEIMLWISTGMNGWDG
jgi:hypothetical protein